MNITNMSAEQLDDLAKACIDRAAALRSSQPPIALALLVGIRDVSYNTVANGYITAYVGDCIVEMSGGKKWRAVGHMPVGDAATVKKQGFIEFIPLSE